MVATRMRGANSTAMARPIATRAPLVDAYAIKFAFPMTAFTEAMFTMQGSGDAVAKRLGELLTEKEWGSLIDRDNAVELRDSRFGKWFVETPSRTVYQTIQHAHFFQRRAHQVARSVRLSQIPHQSDRRICQERIGKAVLDNRITIDENQSGSGTSQPAGNSKT